MPLKNEQQEVTGVLWIISDLTERGNAEKAIAESRNLLQQTATASPDAITVYDLEHKQPLYLNNQLADWIGISVETLTDMGVEGRLQLIHPDDRKALLGFNQEIKGASDGEVLTIEYRIHTKKREYIWIRNRSKVFKRDEQEKVTHVLSVLQDITEYKQAEAEIRNKTHYLERIQDTVPDMISITELASMRFTYLNRKTFKRHGFDPEELEANTSNESKELVHPEDRPLLTAYFEQLKQAQDDEVITAEYRAKDFSSEWKWFLVRGRVFQRNAEGTVSHVLNIIENITVRKAAEQEILHLKDAIAQKATDKYLTLFNSIDEGFCIIEVLFNSNGSPYDYRFLEGNNAFENQTGLTNAIGKSMRELAPAHEEHWFNIYGRIATTGVPERFEIEAKALNRYYEVYAFRIDEPAKHHVAVLFKDITERKQREQQQQFLIKFSDALRTEDDADAIANRALQMLAEYLQLDRCYVGIALLGDNLGIFPYQFGNEKVPPMPAEGVSLSDFPDALRKTFDETLVITDFQNTEGLTETEKQNFATLGFGALVVANVRKEVRNPDWSINAVSATPRQWTNSEISLIEQVTERTWAAVERAKAVQSLHESEAKFKDLVMQSPIPILVCEGKEHIVKIANEAQLGLWGKDWDEVNGKRFIEIEPWGTETEVLFNRIFETGETMHFTEFPFHYMKYGKPAFDYFTTSLAPLHNMSGEIWGIIGLGFAVTEQLESRKRLAENEKKMQKLLKERDDKLADQTKELNELNKQLANEANEWKNILNVMPHYIWTNLPNGLQIFHNAHWLKESGVDPTTNPDLWQGLIHPEDLGKTKLLWEQALVSGREYCNEARIRNVKGQYRWHIARVVPLKDRKGKIRMWVGTSTDIHDLKAAEKKLSS